MSGGLMTPYLNTQMETVGAQVRATFEGLEESQYDFQAHAAMMTPRQMISHLCECYVAVTKMTKGEEHSWGTYTPDATTGAELRSTWESERATAVSALAAWDSEKADEEATGFIVLHDAYHVGQMCTIRLAIDPEWNAYSIYGM